MFFGGKGDRKILGFDKIVGKCSRIGRSLRFFRKGIFLQFEMIVWRYILILNKLLSIVSFI